MWKIYGQPLHLRAIGHAYPPRGPGRHTVFPGRKERAGQQQPPDTWTPQAGMSETPASSPSGCAPEQHVA